MIKPQPEIDWKRRVHKYIDDVLSGEVVACQAVKQACQRHLDDLENLDGYYFDEQTAWRACQFFLQLQFSSGVYNDKWFELHPPQAFIVWTLMGWKRHSDHTRRFRKAFVDVGRGNGKTPLAAGLLLLCSGFDEPIEHGAENYVVATKKDQARDFCWQDARRFAEKAGIVESGYVDLLAGSVVFPLTGAYIKPLGSDSKTQDSMRIHFLALEELHAWTHRDRELFDKLATAVTKREQPLVVIVTTHGNEASTIWRDEYSMAKSVVNPDTPIYDETLFVYIAELDADLGDDIFDESLWEKANPLLPYGVVKLDALRVMASTARLSADSRTAFERFHCNIYTTTRNKPITPAIWARGRGEVPDLAGRECRLGLDLGWRRDLAALAAVFPLDNIEINEEIKRQYAVKVWAWCPLIDNERDLSRAPFKDWIDRGILIPTETRSTDTGAIWKKYEELMDLYWCKSIAIDPNNAREFGQRVIDMMGKDYVCEFRQNRNSFHEPTQEFILAMGEGRVRHFDNPLLAWACENLILSHDASGYCMPDKARSEEKIDPVVATIMALSEVMFIIDGDSFYTDNEVEVV